MKLAFCLFNYFPYGGLQRDFLRIAKECLKRGHRIDVYTMKWEGPDLPGINLYLVPVTQFSNHARCLQYVEQVGQPLRDGHYDLIVGFNKMPYLDVYYAADVCYQARIKNHRPWYVQLTPRYRTYSRLEKAVFNPKAKTKILCISAQQEQAYQDCYATQPSRFHLLPPGIAKDRIAPPDAADIRARVREQYQVGQQDNVLLMVGSAFKTKGVDRSITALASLPDELRMYTQLFIVGDDEPGEFYRLAEKYNVEKQVHFLGARQNVADYLLAADFLLHPSYHENTGTAILEAIVAGLPVLTVATCGYAYYVEDAEAGVVCPEPFKQNVFNTLLCNMLQSDKRQEWRENAVKFARYADIFSMPEKAVTLLETVGASKHEAILTP